jgi:hypothetical protein
MVRTHSLNRLILTSCILLPGLLLVSCSFLCPTKVTRYSVTLEARGAAPGVARTGGMYLAPFDAANEYRTESIVLRSSETGVIEASDNMAWQASAPAVATELFRAGLAGRFPGQVRLSKYPPPEYLVYGRITDMAIIKGAGKSPGSAVFGVFVEVERFTQGAYATVFADTIHCVNQVVSSAGSGADYAAAMSAAVGSAVERCAGVIERQVKAGGRKE